MPNLLDNIYISKVDEKLYVNGEVSDLPVIDPIMGTIEFFANYDSDVDPLSPDIQSSNNIIMENGEVLGIIETSFSIPTGISKISWELVYNYDVDSNTSNGEIYLNNFSYTETTQSWDYTNKKTVEKIKTDFEVFDLDPVNTINPSVYASIIVYPANTILEETDANTVFESNLFDIYPAKFPYSEEYVYKKILNLNTNDTLSDIANIYVKDFLLQYGTFDSEAENNVKYLLGFKEADDIKIAILTSAINCEVGNNVDTSISTSYVCSTNINTGLSVSEQNLTVTNAEKLPTGIYSTTSRISTELTNLNYPNYPNNYFCEVTASNEASFKLLTISDGTTSSPFSVPIFETLTIDFKFIDECGNYFSEDLSISCEYGNRPTFNYGAAYVAGQVTDGFVDLSGFSLLIQLPKNEY